MKCGIFLLFSLACLAQFETADCQPSTRIKFPFHKPSGDELIEQTRNELKYSLGGKPLQYFEDDTHHKYGYISDADFRWLTDYLKSKNIYINRDGLLLMYGLNLGSWGRDRGWQQYGPAPSTQPDYPPAETAVQADADNRYSQLARPDPSGTRQFLNQKTSFDSLYHNIYENQELRRGWRDTLAFFQTTILPIVSEHSNTISRSLMDYYSLTLAGINHLLSELMDDQKSFAANQYAIRSMIEDFQIPDEMLPRRLSHQSTRNAPLQTWFATYRQVSSRPGNINTLNSPANANVYVFKITREGRQRRNPEMNAYEVYYGPNGMVYSLTPGCDTLSYFVLHPTNRASNLPIVLGKGNYCFVLKELATGKLTMRRNVNLANEAAYDDSQLVKLCFLAN